MRYDLANGKGAISKFLLERRESSSSMYVTPLGSIAPVRVQGVFRYRERRRGERTGRLASASVQGVAGHRGQRRGGRGGRSHQRGVRADFEETYVYVGTNPDQDDIWVHVDIVQVSRTDPGGIFRSNGASASLPSASSRTPPPLHIHAGWMVSTTKTPTSSDPSQDSLFLLYM